MLFLHALLLFFLLGASPSSTAAILPRGPGPSGNLHTRDLSPRFVHAGGGCDCVNRKIPDFASAAEQDSPSVPKEHMLEGYWHPEDGFECFIHFDAKGQFDFLDPRKTQVRNGNRPFELGIYKRVTQEVFVTYLKNVKGRPEFTQPTHIYLGDRLRFEAYSGETTIAVHDDGMGGNQWLYGFKYTAVVKPTIVA